MAYERNMKRMTSEKYRKRLDSVFRKANQLNHLTRADIYVISFFKGKFSVYNSTEKPGWPPTEEKLRDFFPEPAIRGPANFPNAKLEHKRGHEHEMAASSVDQAGILSRRKKRLRRIAPTRRRVPIARPPAILESPTLE